MNFLENFNLVDTSKASDNLKQKRKLDMGMVHAGRCADRSNKQDISTVNNPPNKDNAIYFFLSSQDEFTHGQNVQNNTKQYQ